MTSSTHLWTESLHLIFSDDHLGDDDKDRGALERRREREKAPSQSAGQEVISALQKRKPQSACDLAKVAELTRGTAGIQTNFS